MSFPRSHMRPPLLHHLFDERIEVFINLPSICSQPISILALNGKVETDGHTRGDIVMTQGEYESINSYLNN